MNQAFSSYIVTETSLGIQCAKVLITEGHQVLGIISNNPGVIRWAIDHNIPHLFTLEEFEKIKPTKTFDYLFSIVNDQIFSSQLLEYPRYYAINYHDAPLPMYGGIHSTSWAIFNNERTHGISWHIMNTLVDAGDIIKQSTFSIEPNETALTLNLKCYAQAIETFRDLIRDLDRGSIHKYSQDLKKRTYYGAHRKPENGGMADWNTAAKDIDRLYRALHFGDYPNKLATFKVLIDKQVFFPHKLEILNTKTKAKPGTIVEIHENSLQITTKTEDVLIADMTDIQGNFCTIPYIINNVNLHKDDNLPVLNKRAKADLQRQLTALSPHEEYWVKTLLLFPPAKFFLYNAIPQKNKQIKKEDKKNYSFILNEIDKSDIKEASKKFKGLLFVDILIAVIMGYFSRLENKSKLRVDYAEPSLSPLIGQLNLFLSSNIFLTLDNSCFLTGERMVQKFIEEKVRAVKNKTFCLDIRERHPNLKKLPYEKSDIKINVVKSKKDPVERKGNYLLEIDIHSKGEKYILAFSQEFTEIEKRFIKEIPNHIHALLKNLLHNPNDSIHDLSLLTFEEQHQLLEEWNDTGVVYPEQKTIHQVFEEQVERTPNNIAVVYEDQSLTYQHLNEKANQLAHYLRTLGVGPDVLVAIAVERSLEMIIGLLGILKAGGAYVPLDPDYPQGRLHFMLEDTNAPLLLTQAHLQDKLKDTLSSYKGKILAIDQMDQTLQHQKIDNPAPLALPHNLAYVIYTSGSTGKPKGVMVNHEGLDNLLDGFRKKVDINASDVFLEVTTFTFDIAGLEIYLPLLKGSLLLIANKEATTNPHQLIKLIDDYNVTLMQGTPSTWQMLLDSQWIGKQELRLLCGGEAPTSYLINKLINKSNTIWNVYGPTETTIWSSAKIYNKENLCTSPSIGRPISNTQIYILDGYMNPVPIGVNGEIYIGGIGLARGYLNRADLTAERFIPNPFMTEEDLREESSRHKSLRLYRTGDLARYLPDGNIEFIGRIDDQVKIRGFRIELGEIESVLSQHKDVSQALVIAREDEPGYKQLVAYVVPPERLTSSLEKGAALTSSSQEGFALLKGESLPSLTEELRTHLSRSLPDYMIPAFFVFIDKVPLTSNGKIDRKALHTGTSLDDNKTSIIYPETSVQFQIFNLWQNSLNLKNISIHDNFFNIGGNSLTAIKIISQLQKNLSNKISIIDIFNNPTIYSLARMIELEREHAINVSVIPIQASGKGSPLFLIHPGGGLSFCYMGLTKYIFDIPIYGVNNPHFKNLENGFTSIEEMARAYIKLIKSIQKTGPYLLGGWSFGGIVAYEMAQQITSQGEKVENVLLIDVRVPINNLQINFFSKEGIAKEEGYLYLEPIMDKNLYANKEMMFFYKIEKYKGNLILIKSIDDNKNETLTVSRDYGWGIFVENIQIIDTPGQHLNLFNSEYLQSTAESIKIGLSRSFLKPEKF